MYYLLASTFRIKSVAVVWCIYHRIYRKVRVWKLLSQTRKPSSLFSSCLISIQIGITTLKLQAFTFTAMYATPTPALLLRVYEHFWWSVFYDTVFLFYGNGHRLWSLMYEVFTKIEYTVQWLFNEFMHKGQVSG